MPGPRGDRIGREPRDCRGSGTTDIRGGRSPSSPSSPNSPQEAGAGRSPPCIRPEAVASSRSPRRVGRLRRPCPRRRGGGSPAPPLPAPRAPPVARSSRDHELPARRRGRPRATLLADCVRMIRKSVRATNFPHLPRISEGWTLHNPFDGEKAARRELREFSPAPRCANCRGFHPLRGCTNCRGFSVTPAALYARVRLIRTRGRGSRCTRDPVANRAVRAQDCSGSAGGTERRPAGDSP